MNQLPLIDLYPISDRPLDEREIMLHDAALKSQWPTQPLRVQQTITNARDFVLHTLHHYGGSGVVNAFRSQLKEYPPLREAKSAMPYLKDSALLKHYQRGSGTVCVASLNDEIRRFGRKLATGQVLFHGGSCHANEVTSFTTSKPLSTSFCPQIAAWHAYHDLNPAPNPNPAIWILSAAFGNKKAVIYRKGAPGMENEQEVLIESGSTISPRRMFNVHTASANVLVIEAMLS